MAALNYERRLIVCAVTTKTTNATNPRALVVHPRPHLNIKNAFFLMSLQ